MSVIYLETLVATMKKTVPAHADRMKEHFRLFSRKYLPDFEEAP
jgi:hypothetical protein